MSIMVLLVALAAAFLGLAHHADLHVDHLGSGGQQHHDDDAHGGPGEAGGLDHAQGVRGGGAQVDAQEVVIHVHPPADAVGKLGVLGVDGVDQVDLAVGGELVEPVLQDGGALLVIGQDGAHVDAGGDGLLHQGLADLLAQHHEVGDGLADDVVEGDEDGHGDEAPQAAAHGVDAVLLIEPLLLLRHLLAVVGVALLDLLQLAGDHVHADHAALALHHEGQQHQLHHQGEEDESHAVGTGELIELSGQPGEGPADPVTKGRKHRLSSESKCGGRARSGHSSVPSGRQGKGRDLPAGKEGAHPGNPPESAPLGYLRTKDQTNGTTP